MFDNFIFMLDEVSTDLLSKQSVRPIRVRRKMTLFMEAFSVATGQSIFSLKAIAMYFGSLN